MHESSSDLTHTDMDATDGDHDSPSLSARKTKAPVSVVKETLDENLSMAYQTMTGVTAERNLFSEERFAAKVGRSRPGLFAPGQKIGISIMYLQEKLDGDLGKFKLKRRHDRIGYNSALSPFIVMSGSQ